MEYKAQYCPGETKIAENRRKHMNPEHEFKKIRDISDEGLVKILGHRNPGESYKTVHPPLAEMEDDGDIIKHIVEPTPGAKEGIRVRYIQFADSMYNAPAQPYDRARTYLWRYRGVDTGTLSGRQVIEIREQDLEKIAKELVETDIFDPARCGMRGATVHGHSLRLDENGLMFDGLQRYIFNEEDGHVYYVKDQVGRPLDEMIDVGAPLDEDYLKEITTIYREDNIGMRQDKEAIEVVENIHTARTEGGYGMHVFSEDLKRNWVNKMGLENKKFLSALNEKFKGEDQESDHTSFYCFGGWKQSERKREFNDAAEKLAKERNMPFYGYDLQDQAGTSNSLSIRSDEGLIHELRGPNYPNYAMNVGHQPEYAGIAQAPHAARGDAFCTNPLIKIAFADSHNTFDFRHPRKEIAKGALREFMPSGERDIMR